MKRHLKSILAFTPYRIVRNNGLNRFLAIDESLRGMRQRGFDPKIVIDGGACVGSFSVETQKIFPHAEFHLVEPQAACAPVLRKLAEACGFIVHECALSDRSETLKITKTEEPNTGAYINPIRGEETLPVTAATLDDLFAEAVTANMRGFLKLDLQGYEMKALRGARKLLHSLDAVLIEFVMFPYGNPIAEIVEFFDANEFELYEVAALAARPRDNRLQAGDSIFGRRGSALLADGAGS